MCITYVGRRLRRSRYNKSNSAGSLAPRSMATRYRTSHHHHHTSSTRHHQKNLQTVKALAQRTQGRSGRKQPHTVTAQFQQSLQALMETLNTANPYFIRCIKSNANKVCIVHTDEVQWFMHTHLLLTILKFGHSLT